MLAPSQHHSNMNFTCASCGATIAATDPRVRCLVCVAPCDMCANCVLGERFKAPHQGAHAVQVLKQSGGTSTAAGAGGGGADLGGSLVVEVPTVLGTTAICYYPPQPVPTLPVVSEGQGQASDAVLDSAVAQLSLGAPESEVRDIAEPWTGQDANAGGHVGSPSFQPPVIGQEQHHQPDGRDHDPNGHSIPPAMQPPADHSRDHDPNGHFAYPTRQQLPAGHPQQGVSAEEFWAQHQAVPPQGPDAHSPHPISERVDEPPVPSDGPPTYQYAPPAPVTSPLDQDQPPTFVPAVPTYDHASPVPVASPPAGSSQQVEQLPGVGAGPPTYYDPSSLPRNASHPVDHAPRTGTAPSPYDPSPVPVASSQQVDGPPVTGGAQATYYHGSPAASQPVDQAPIAVTASSMTYDHAAPNARPLPGPPQQFGEPPAVVGAAPPAYYHASSTSAASPPASTYQHGDQAHTVAAPIPQASAGASPLVGFSQPRDQPPVGSAYEYEFAAPAASAGSSQQMGQIQASGVGGAAVPGYQLEPPTPVTASSGAGPFEQAGQPYGVGGAASAYQHAAPFTSSSPAPSSSFRHADQQPVVVGAASTYQHPAPVASSPAGSFRYGNQLPGGAAAPSTYQHIGLGASSPASSFQRMDQTSTSVAPALPHTSAVGSLPPGAFQPAVPGVPSAYQPAASSPAGSFQQVSQPSTVASGSAVSAYSHASPVASPPTSFPQQMGQAHVAPVGVSSPAGSFQQVGQSSVGATVPPMYQHEAQNTSGVSQVVQPSMAQPAAYYNASAPVGSSQPPAVASDQYAAPGPTVPAGSFQHVGQTPTAGAYSGYHHTPPPTGPSSIPPTPPPVPPRRATAGRPTSYGSPRPPSVAPNLPQYQNTGTYQDPSSASGSSGWQPFFLADMSPSPTFVTLLNDVFTHLDRHNLGNLEPEVFSGFLDDLGYPPHENAWKSGLQPTYALSAQSMADKAFKNALDLFAIDHILLRRIQPPHEDPTCVTAQYKRIFGASFKPAMLQDPGAPHSTIEGPMPAITRKGFIDIMAFEAKGEPAREWGRWSRLVRSHIDNGRLPRYYAAWGDLPRECFLEHPDPATLRRVEEVRSVAERQAQAQLAAARASAQVRALGRQNASELVGNVRYVYR